MKITVLSPWKQEISLEAREKEYIKRLGRYSSFEIEEIKGAKGETRDSVRREGEKLLSRLRKGTCLVALTERGLGLDSEGLSRWLGSMAILGRSDVTFVIGGAAGLDKGLLENADMELSLSPMTMQHQLARLVLLEQLYRAFTILRGEPYHK